MNKRKICALLLFATLSLSLSGCYFFPQEEPLLEPPVVKVEDVNYKTYVAQQKDIARIVVATGYLMSKEETNIYFEQALYPMKVIHVKPGDFVKKGDLLAELDTNDLPRRLKLQKLIVQKAQATYNNSGSAADLAQLNIEKQLLSDLEEDEQKSKIFASRDGQVSFTKKIAAGGQVTPHDAIVKIVDPDSLYVKYTSTSLRDFTLGKEVKITIDKIEYDAVVTKTPKEAITNNEDDTTSIYFEFTNGQPNFLSIGALAEITATYEISKNAVVIPRTIVKYLDDRTYVQIIDGDKKVDVDVTVGIQTATEIEITSGLKVGDKVVVG